MAVIRDSSNLFDEIPKEILTEEICLHALKYVYRSGGTVIDRIPKNLITQEMCNLSIAVSAFSVRYIPEEFVTEEILLSVAYESPSSLGYNFPERLRTRAFIQELIDTCPNGDYYIKNHGIDAIDWKTLKDKLKHL